VDQKALEHSRLRKRVPRRSPFCGGICSNFAESSLYYQEVVCIGHRATFAASTKYGYILINGLADSVPKDHGVDRIGGDEVDGH
jgi:hypothetical protein